MGCGRTGAALATEFEARGHTVAIIDRTSDAFRRLPSGFSGQKITGIGFDRETLQTAGVEGAYGFAAVSSGDNSNILAARVVRETYGVDNVVARISDPGRAAVYRRLGITTVAPVPWTSAQIVSRLLPGGHDELFRDEAAGVVVARLSFHDAWIGRPVLELGAAVGGSVSYVVRFGDAMFPDATSALQDGDEVVVAMPIDALRQAVLTAATSPEEER